MDLFALTEITYKVMENSIFFVMRRDIVEYDAHAILTKASRNSLKIATELCQRSFSKDLIHSNDFLKKRGSKRLNLEI